MELHVPGLSRKHVPDAYPGREYESGFGYRCVCSCNQFVGWSTYAEMAREQVVQHAAKEALQ